MKAVRHRSRRALFGKAPGLRMDNSAKMIIHQCLIWQDFRLTIIMEVTGAAAMRHKRFNTMACPIARSLDRVGEWWSILILRDACAGMTRFDQFETSLGIAPAMLTRRLKALVDAGLLERQRYSDHPPRDEYILTQAGEDFRPILLAMFAWGNANFTPEGRTMQIVDAATGEAVEPVLVDARTGRKLHAPDFRIVPGPAASPAQHQRLAGGGGVLGWRA